MIWKLIRNKIYHKKFNTIIIVFALVVSLLFSVFLQFIYQNIENFLITQQIGQVNLKRFTLTKTVVNNKISHIFNTNSNELEDINKELLRDPNISQIYQMYNINVPAYMQISMGDKSIASDLLLFAISDNYFIDHNIPLGPLATMSTIPSILNESIIDFYNINLAANNSFFPHIPKFLFQQIPIKLTVGKSEYLNFNSKTQDVICKVALTDPNVPLIGLTIPYSYAQEILNQIGIGRMVMGKILGFVKDESYLKNLQTKYSDAIISTDENTIYKIKSNLQFVRIGFYIFNLLGQIILWTFLVYITHSIIQENQKLFFILRLHGANKLMIYKLIIGENLGYYIFSSVIVMGLLIIFQKIFLNLLSEFIRKIGDVNYIFINLSVNTIGFILISQLLVIILIGSIFSFSERNKKYELIGKK